MDRIFAVALLVAFLLAAAANPIQKGRKTVFSDLGSHNTQKVVKEEEDKSSEELTRQHEEGHHQFMFPSQLQSQQTKSKWVALSTDGEVVTDTHDLRSLLELARKAANSNSEKKLLAKKQRRTSAHKNRRTKRAIFGTDDRKLDVDHLPYSAIGYLPGSKCTGFLVAPNVVMTAAHCMFEYNDKDEKFYYRKSFDFYRGRNCMYQGERMNWTSVFVPWDYLNNPLFGNDYGLILLGSTSPSYIPYATVPLGQNGTVPIKLIAYSEDRKQCSTSTSCSAKLISDIFVETEKTFCYDCDTLSESSGAPILHKMVTQTNSNRSPVTMWEAIGVNNGNLHDLSGPCNVGARFTAQRVLDIREEIERDVYSG